MRLNKKEWNEIKQLIEEGESISGIARDYNISRNSVYVHLRKRNLKRKNTFLNRLLNKISIWKK